MKKVVSILFALCIIISSFCVTPANAASNKQQEINSLESKSKELEAEISKIKGEKSQQQKRKDLLVEQITTIDQQINAYTDAINSLKAEIAASEAEIKAKEALIESTKTLLKQRIRAIYMNGNANNDLLLLLGSDNFSDYLTSRGLAKSISAKDKSVIDEVNKAITVIEESQKEIKVKIEEQQSAKKLVDEKHALLAEKKAEIDSVIYELSKDQTALQNENKKTEAEINRIYNEINAGMQQNGNQNLVYGGGAFGWPVPGHYNITSYYGQRWGRLHKGIDISSGGIYGKPIVAAMDGKVLVSGWSTGGYGYYVTINHGYKDGKYYTTLYAHMSRRACSAGQYVKKGQVIGYVGSTGDSTGPHLHFEILVNGVATNPMPYLK